MGLAVLSSNTSIKVNTAVNGVATSTIANNTVTLYTAPANAYAIVQLVWFGVAGSTATYKIAGNALAIASTGASGSYFAGQSNNSIVGPVVLGGFYVGPGQVLSVTFAGAVNGNIARATGVEFINSP